MRIRIKPIVSAQKVYFKNLDDEGVTVYLFYILGKRNCFNLPSQEATRGWKGGVVRPQTVRGWYESTNAGIVFPSSSYSCFSFFLLFIISLRTPFIYLCWKCSEIGRK